MGAIAIPIVIIIVALVAAGAATVRFSRARRDRADDLRRRGQTLRYEVPNGLDPAEVVLELSRAGYEAVPDTSLMPSGELLIGGRADQPLDREEIRQILADITEHAIVDPSVEVTTVRFLDE